MDELELEDSSECMDSVRLYDGRTENSSMLYSYCSQDSSTLTSSGSSVLVVFESDESVSDGGFALSWSFDIGDGEGRRFSRVFLIRLRAFSSNFFAHL